MPDKTQQYRSTQQHNLCRPPALILTAGILLLPFLAGCPPITVPDLSDPNPTSAQLLQFDSADAILNYARQRQEEQRSGRNTNLTLLDALFGGAFGPPESVANADDAGSGDAPDFTSTNAQEVGVGEADVLQSDGEYFYIARRQQIKIVDANPADQMNTLATIDSNNPISDMYLSGDTLIVIGFDWEELPNNPDIPRIMIWPPYFNKSITTVTQYDISDRTAPVLVAESTLDGSMATSRLVDGRLILVLTQTPNLAASADPESFEEIAPQVTVDGVTTAIGTPDTWYYPLNPDGLFTTAVLSVDATNVESLLGSLTILAGAGTIYMSPEALYLTDMKHDPGDDLRPFTAIHKITFDEEGVPQYAASGSVPGRLLNQFSLSEHEGVLRVASHIDDNRWFGWGIAEDIAAQSNTPEGDFNAVYILDQNGEALEIVGRVENLAPGEQIYAARFMGTRGFVVTFEQVDPLFVLDLSDPNNPQVLGELKIPGFSDYLHPVDENTLIGIGQSTELFPSGFVRTNGVQISLFDVSDWSNPQVIEQQTLGGAGSWTDVSNTHKAFAYLPESQIMAFPATLYASHDDFFRGPEAEGIFAYQVDPNSGFTQLAQLSSVNDDIFYWQAWRRPAMIGDALYAVTQEGVRALNFTNPETVFELAFPEESFDF